MKKFLPHLVALIIIAIPIFLFAAGGGGVQTTIKNPLGENKSVDKILLSIMNIVAMVGGVVVVFFIIFSGFKFVTAQGNESEVTKAKEMFYATVIGGAILLGADVIANIVVGTISAIKK